MHYFEHASKFRLTSKPSINKMKSFLPKAIEYRYDPIDYIWIICGYTVKNLNTIMVLQWRHIYKILVQHFYIDLPFSIIEFWVIINCDITLKRYWDGSRENKPSDVRT